MKDTVLKMDKIQPTPMPPPQKLFYKPGTIEQSEENVYDEPKPKATPTMPLLRKNGQGYLLPTIIPFNRVHTSPSLTRLSTTNSLSRISTCASSIYTGSIIRNESSRKSFRPYAAKKMRKRAVFKNGDCNILQSRISKRRLRYLQDIFTTLVDSQWRWTLTIFAVGFLGSWLLFALLWWLIVFSHGDLEEEHLPIHQADSNWAPCVLNIHGFTSCFLFSIETQHTIGYGVRTPTEECPEAIFMMCLQSIAGMIIQAFMVGIVFAKMTRPKLRTQTLQFSKNALICLREGKLCLMFRVGDMRKSHIIGASIRAQLIHAKRTKEGEILTNFQTELEVHADGCGGNLFFIWPMVIVHRIEETSPFYFLSAADMLQEKFEIVVILEGTIESTGQTTQARSSFLANEVLWGHRFEPVVSYNKDRQGYEVNYSKFDNTLLVDTPLCSAAELAQFYKMQECSGGELRQPQLHQQPPFSYVVERFPSQITSTFPENKKLIQPSTSSGSSGQQQDIPEYTNDKKFEYSVVSKEEQTPSSNIQPEVSVATVHQDKTQQEDPDRKLQDIVEPDENSRLLDETQQLRIQIK